jgi:hypothetical protein
MGLKKGPGLEIVGVVSLGCVRVSLLVLFLLSQQKISQTCAVISPPKSEVEGGNKTGTSWNDSQMSKTLQQSPILHAANK